MAETIRTPETQADLATLTENLHSDEQANLLLFLAHLSRDRSIIEGMLRQAELVFAGIDEAELRGTLGAGSEAVPSLPLKVDDRPVSERQRDLMRAIDHRLSERSGVEPVSPNAEPFAAVQAQLDAIQEIVKRFAGAYRTLQILGQTVKNFPGSMSGKEKLQVVGSVFSVGLRTLGALLELIRANEAEVKELVADTIRKADPLTSDHEVLREAQRTIHGMAHMASYGLIRRIAHAVGSRDLEPVYQRLVDANSTPATEAIRVALRLEQFSEKLPLGEIERLAAEFEGKHPRAYELLRHLVYHYLQVFDVSYSEKQSVCDRLGISYKELRSVNPSRKMLRASTAAG